MDIIILKGKQQDIFDAAKTLFWKYGIKKVSIEEICREANVSKMTFYKFFPNKIELARTVWLVLTEVWMQTYDNIVHDDNILFQEKIMALFKLKHDAAKGVSMEFVQDLYKDIDLQGIVIEYQQRSISLFKEFFMDSQEKGLIRKDIKIEFVMFQINMMSSIMDDKELLSVYDNVEELAIESMNFLFYGLLP